MLEQPSRLEQPLSQLAQLRPEACLRFRYLEGLRQHFGQRGTRQRQDASPE